MKTITLEVRPEDVESILRQAAEDAAKYSAWHDHLTSGKIGNLPTDYRKLPDARKSWHAKFLRAKRIVEAFGVEYEQTSEPETMTVAFPYVGGKVKVLDVGGMKVGMQSGSQPDYKRPYPSYYSGVHAEACRQAASRVVRRWQAMLSLPAPQAVS